MPLVNPTDKDTQVQTETGQQSVQQNTTQGIDNSSNQQNGPIDAQLNNNMPNQVNNQGSQQQSVNQSPQVLEQKGPAFTQQAVQPQESMNPNLSQQSKVLTNQQNSPAQGVNPSVTNLQQSISIENSPIGTYLDLCENRNASDLHFTVDYPPLLRIDGKLERIGSQPMTKERIEELFIGMIDEKELKRYKEERELDFSYQHTSGSRFRVNLYFEKGNMAGAFRLIPAKIRTFSELGLPEVMESFTKLPHGLVLVTGPTGSGKSTTLAAILNEINMTYPKHIITIEDPIEYLYPVGQALVDQREIGKDSMSWTNALKYLLRQDPDVVLVGEMRDFETISSTITVAETGHLVFATLHTNSASQTVDRIIDVFPEHQQDQVRAQLAVVLQAVIAQRLVPLAQGGRKAVHEILLGTAAVRNAIREGKTYQIDNIIQTSADAGMVLIEKPLAELVRTGEITFETAMDFTNKPSELRNLVQG